ncbi:MAG: 30S ribosomal protein S1 [Bacillota bacterium]|nr:30S ribosomal protein S1 [Bacillota bacterium]
MENMEDLMKELNDSIKVIHPGDILKGTVLAVKEDEVLVNIGYMTDGIIAREELSSDPRVNPRDVLNVGDEIFAYVIEVNDGEGNVALSKKMADSVKVWDDLRQLKDEEKTLTVRIKEAVKGGVTADVKGVRAFIPASQLSLRHVEDLGSFVGKDLEVAVMELDEEKRRIILSRKEIERKEADANKTELWATLKKGEKRRGTVTRLARFGAFVDLGGVDGLVHNNDLSWKRIFNPADVVSVGDAVEVYVLDFDKATGRISLGLKDVAQNPWNGVKDKYPAGAVVDGTVVRVVDFGAFVELEPGVEGLVHISEISEERVVKTSDVLKASDKVKVKILEVDPKKEKISLSIKEATAKPQEDYSQYNTSDDSGTIGDLFKEKFKNFKFD